MIELFEHNKSAYEAALALLEETNRTCVIHPWAPASSEAVRGYPRNKAGVPAVSEGVISEFGTGLKAWVQHQNGNLKKRRLDSTQRMRWEERIGEASAPVQRAAGRRKPAAAATL